MTVLVLDLRVPSHPIGTLLDGLLAQWAAYVSFFASRDRFATERQPAGRGRGLLVFVHGGTSQEAGLAAARASCSP